MENLQLWLLPYIQTQINLNKICKINTTISLSLSLVVSIFGSVRLSPSLTPPFTHTQHQHYLATHCDFSMKMYNVILLFTIDHEKFISIYRVTSAATTIGGRWFQNYIHCNAQFTGKFVFSLSFAHFHVTFVTVVVVVVTNVENGNFHLMKINKSVSDRMKSTRHFPFSTESISHDSRFLFASTRRLHKSDWITNRTIKKTTTTLTEDGHLQTNMTSKGLHHRHIGKANVTTAYRLYSPHICIKLVEFAYDMETSIYFYGICSGRLAFLDSIRYI